MTYNPRTALSLVISSQLTNSVRVVLGRSAFHLTSLPPLCSFVLNPLCLVGILPYATSDLTRYTILRHHYGKRPHPSLSRRGDYPVLPSCPAIVVT